MTNMHDLNLGTYLAIQNHVYIVHFLYRNWNWYRDWMDGIRSWHVKMCPFRLLSWTHSCHMCLFSYLIRSSTSSTTGVLEEAGIAHPFRAPVGGVFADHIWVCSFLILFCVIRFVLRLLILVFRVMTCQMINPRSNLILLIVTNVWHGNRALT